MEKQTKYIFKYIAADSPQIRKKLVGHQGMVVWLTGLSGAGKSTISFVLEKRLLETGCLAYCLDGDNLRFGINENLGFSEQDRSENVRRIAHIARLFKDACFIVIVACISPASHMRENAKAIIGTEGFLEVFVKADIKTCQQRDPKGLYKKVQNGEIKNFTGINMVYEEPAQSNIIVDTEKNQINECVGYLFSEITKRIDWTDDK
ncbi:adenylyl-sulfate kinase [Sporomusa sphaeroides]|uniref:adenylyl-sulfate kinase n=1 Tax=Sporomusa sphaeroides TaxID=47679 RepID=UPI0031597104